MASSRQIQAGKAFVTLFLKDDMTRNLRRSLRAAGDSMKNLGAQAMTAGGAMLGPIAGAVTKFAAAGDQLDKMALRTGVSVESLSELKFAAEQSGTSIEAFGAVMQKMNRRIGRVTAGEGTATQTKAIEALGLSIEQLRGMNAEERFMAIADAMASYGDNAAAAGLAQRAFGTGVDALLPMIFSGRKGIESLRKEARELGITLSTEDAQAAAKLTDQMNRLKQTVVSIAYEVGRTLAEAFLGAGAQLTDLSTTFREWISQNKRTVVLVAKLGATLLAVGGTLYTFGVILGGVATAIKAVTVAITFLIAHPVVAVFAGIGAALLVLQHLTKQTAELSNAMAKAREEGDKQRKSDQARMAQLQQLAAQESRNAQEMQTAKTLIAELEERYGQLGIAIDETTGAITGMTAAQSKLNAEQAKQAKQELKREILERQRNVKELANEMQNPGWLRGAGEFWGALSEDSRLNKTQARIDAQRKEIDQLVKRYQQIGEGDIAGALGETPSAGTGAPTPDRGIGPGEDDEEADEYAEQRRRDAEQRLRDEIARLQIEGTKEGYEKELALLDLEEQQSLREANKSGADSALVRRQFALRRQLLSPEQQDPAESSASGIVPRTGLSATYSAAAARISGYQPAGPEQKMADGIQQVAKNTQELTRLQEEFLAGWRVA